MIRLYTAADLPDAYLMLGLLERHGIDARVFNENAQGGLGEIPFTQAYPEIWLLDERDLNRGRELVAQYQSASAPVAEIRCPACGEKNPENFEICWACGKPL
jgi:hypothetical protein